MTAALAAFTVSWMPLAVGPSRCARTRLLSFPTRVRAMPWTGALLCCSRSCTGRGPLRVRQMRDWLRRAGVLRCGGVSPAENHAAELGLRLDAAHAANAELAGLALDWSKCYDRIPLSLLEQGALRPASRLRCGGPTGRPQSRPMKCRGRGLTHPRRGRPAQLPRSHLIRVLWRPGVHHSQAWRSRAPRPL